MSWTRVACIVFIVGLVCVAAPGSQASQTNISVSFSSGSLALYSDYGPSGFSASDGLNLYFQSTAFNGTNYTDTNGTLSFMAGSTDFTGLAVSGATSQSSSSGWTSWPEYCSWWSCSYEYEYWGSTSDVVSGTFMAGAPLEIGKQPYQITSGWFNFSYSDGYTEYCYYGCGYYPYWDFNGGNINLTATPDPVVPEPSTWFTMGTGLLLLGFLFRREILHDPGHRTQAPQLRANA